MDCRMTPLLTYVLQLENNKYYVGISWNLNLRIAEHLQGLGSKWTRMHKPKRIINVIIGNRERDTTLHMMMEKGWQNVRGASWCQVELTVPPKCLQDAKLVAL